MRIVHLLWGLSTGGIENMLVDIVNEQVEGNEISLIVINDMVDQNIVKKLDKRVKIFFCKRRRKSKNPLPLLKLNFYLRRIKPSIVHVHYDELARFVVGKWNMVRTIHNTTNDFGESKYFSACYAISKAVQDEWKLAGKETILVENGLACESINSQKNELFNDELLHFVQVSRLYIKQKGQDILLNALAKIKKDNLCEINFRMHLIGDGPSREILQDKAKTLEISDIVVFEGNKSREWVYDNLCNFDLFIQPSRYEGFGLTVAEAMVAKVPVLTSHIEGPVEIMTLRDEKRETLLGTSFQSENANDLAEKIAQFVRLGRNENIVEMGRQHILECYNVKKTAARYLEEYKKIIGDR